jgi:hypothetical protein
MQCIQVVEKSGRQSVTGRVSAVEGGGGHMCARRRCTLTSLSMRLTDFPCGLHIREPFSKTRTGDISGCKSYELFVCTFCCILLLHSIHVSAANTPPSVFYDVLYVYIN